MAVAVITGGVSGIGLNFVRKLLATTEKTSFALVILAARNEARCTQVLETLRDAVPADGRTKLEVLPCDIASLASVAAFCEAVKMRAKRVDLFVCNAGVLAGPMMSKASALSADGFELTFGVNHLAHFDMFQRLLPLLKAGKARVVLTASRGHADGKPPRQGRDAVSWKEVATIPSRCSCMQAYFDSKLANVLMAREVQRRFAAEGITANSLHPGAIRETGIWNDQVGGFIGFLLDGLFVPLGRLFGLWQTLDEGGDAILACALAEDGAGRYRNVGKWEEPKAVALDDQSAAALWEASEDLLRDFASK